MPCKYQSQKNRQRSDSAGFAGQSRAHMSNLATTGAWSEGRSSRRGACRCDTRHTSARAPARRGSGRCAGPHCGGTRASGSPTRKRTSPAARTGGSNRRARRSISACSAARSGGLTCTEPSQALGSCTSRSSGRDVEVAEHDEVRIRARAAPSTYSRRAVEPAQLVRELVRARRSGRSARRRRSRARRRSSPRARASARRRSRGCRRRRRVRGSRDRIATPL